MAIPGNGNIIDPVHYLHSLTWHKSGSVGQQNIAIIALDLDIVETHEPDRACFQSGLPYYRAGAFWST